MPSEPRTPPAVAFVDEQDLYRWRRQYGGLGERQAVRLRELERENAQMTKTIIIHHVRKKFCS